MVGRLVIHVWVRSPSGKMGTGQGKGSTATFHV